jgi:pimeloyl-ACP methyl ester carboxylesterase
MHILSFLFLSLLFHPSFDNVSPAEESGYPAGHFLQSTHLITQLSLSNAPGKRPLIILLHGSDGGMGMTNGWSEAFHWNGFHVLGMTYFDKTGRYSIPTQLTNIRLESFAEELDQYLKVHGDVIDKDQIGIFGVSKGGELALLLGSLYPQFKFVVAMVPSHVVFQSSAISPVHHSSWTLDGIEVPFVPFPFPNDSLKTLKCVLSLMTSVISQQWVSCTDMHIAAMAGINALERTGIKVERINGPVVFVSGDADQYWPSALMSEMAQARLNRTGFAHPYLHLAFRGDHFAYGTQENWDLIFDSLHAVVDYTNDKDKCRQKLIEVQQRFEQSYQQRV